MDRYAHRLIDWLDSIMPGFPIEAAGAIGDLTQDAAGGRRRRSGPRWWARHVDLSVLVPPPLVEPYRWFARYLAYPRVVKRQARNASLVHVLDHSYAHVSRAVKRKPVVVTVHDLMPVIVLRQPGERWTDGIRHYFMRKSLKALREVQAYIVATQWLKKELATWLGDDRRVHVVPMGVDRAFFADDPQGRERGRRQWRLPEESFVVLHVGSTVERKNVPLAIHTVARLRAEADAHLLQVGGRFTDEQERLIEDAGLRPYVRQVAQADEPTLRRAYRCADVLLFPSLYEGFGFPVLEAFASACPVVASGAGGLREVGGDSAVFVESRDPQGYVDAILELGEDSNRREWMVVRGRERAQKFSWRTTAEMTADVYRKLL
jgi:glycosyltransferase involved in cell wall biosynthesis